MLINKAYKFSLYSNELQKEIINKTLDCSRLIYNHYLNKEFKNKRYTCPNCHNELDRDYNASENIMFEGLKRFVKEILA